MRRINVARENRLAAIEVLKKHEVTFKEYGESFNDGRPIWVFGVDDGNAEQAYAVLKDKVETLG